MSGPLYYIRRPPRVCKRYVHNGMIKCDRCRAAWYKEKWRPDLCHERGGMTYGELTASALRVTATIVGINLAWLAACALLIGLSWLFT